MVQGLASESERTTDVLLDVPWSVGRTLTYALPEGATILRIPEAVALDTPDLGYTRTVTRSEGPDGRTAIVVEERLELRTHRVPVGRYSGFREAARKVDSAQRQNLSVEVSQ